MGLSAKNSRVLLLFLCVIISTIFVICHTTEESAEAVNPSEELHSLKDGQSTICKAPSFIDAVLNYHTVHAHDFRQISCLVDGNGTAIFCGSRVNEVNESTLAIALDSLKLQNKSNTSIESEGQIKRSNYVAVLFYASWCPFSQVLHPLFYELAPLFPGVVHIAVEESRLRPSVLSKYGIHSFPQLFVENSTLRFKFGGPRTVKKISRFITNITGEASMETYTSTTSTAATAAQCPAAQALPASPSSSYALSSTPSPHGAIARGRATSCPYPWATNPNHWFTERTLLCIAAAFLFVRLLVHLKGSW
eukprot:TRINITY_DN16544_c0_g1_i1.p1 TRINITY_DN16544_c0_g1~~TRINITY_DN16544_c0_g1_i1.p1  ORF type:complete len:306 (+),score=40.05 TRINITY_DN16544_c0_g1_i1:78-995(+)